MRSKSVPTHEGVVAELMRRQLGISTATANESARRLPQEADAGGLSKEIVVLSARYCCARFKTDKAPT
jgi:hypothetical protein